MSRKLAKGGATTGSSKLWKPAHPWFTGCANNWWKKAHKVVELGIVECQRQHDRARAQKNTLQPHRRQHWVIPPKANSAFVAAMEDVLAVYTRPRDGDCPLVCLDETSKQLIAETRVPISMKAGRPARFDYEYERNGTANLFMMFAPLEGWRH